LEFNHVSVLLKECIEGLDIKPDGVYVDATLGGAGHSKEICKKLSSTGKLIGIDQDAYALEYAKNILAFSNANFVHDNFSNIDNILGDEKVDGILMDLGVSSYQLDEASRGFSYMNDAPLDMRMNIKKPFTAYDIINNYDENKLFGIIQDYGEERWAKRIAEFIVKSRSEKEIETTFELVSVIKKAVPKGARTDGPHPAKRTFQAIRIEVNNELGILKDSINYAVNHLNLGGRLCIITFHSLEDRIVKNAFRELENPCNCPREFPICVCEKKPSVKVITRKPISPSKEELESNHRARSAKLRIVQKI